MILKIEQWIFLPAEGRLQNKKRVFSMIDHVEDVKFGDVVPIEQVPHPMPMPDGSVQDVELFLPEDHSDGAGEKEEGSLMVSLIHFTQGGRAPRLIASSGTVYLCNDQGDTLEVIRAN